MTIQINYLENFLKVTEVGSISKTADQLNVSQSAISQQIYVLEKYFDTKLFKRTIRGVSLTSAGEILLKRVKIILDNLELAKVEIGNKIDELRGILNISSSTIPGEHILPLIFAKFKKVNPEVKINTEINDTTTSLNKLLNNEVELAAVGSLIDSQGLLEKCILAEEELVLVVSNDHPLSENEIIDPKTILKYPYIIRELNSGTRLESEKILNQIGIPLDEINILCELTTTESILTAVAEGLGISLVSSIAASKMEAAGLIKILRFPSSIKTKRKLYLIRKKDYDKKNLMLQSFWDFVVN